MSREVTAAAAAGPRRRGELPGHEEPARQARARTDTPFERAVAAVYRPDRRSPFRDDPVAAAKVVVEYANRNDKLTIVGGGLAGQQIDAAGVRELASLPSLDELRGRLIGLLQAPAAQLARVLQAPAGQVARVLAAYAESQGESASRWSRLHRR